jgi:hypothetical protein
MAGIPNEGDATMKRSIRMIALGLAAAAILPVAAQAKPIPSDQYLPANQQGILQPGEIPYLSQGVGVDSRYFSSDILQPGVLGGVSSQSSDDRPFSRATSVGAPAVDSSNGSSVDWRDFTVTGFALGLVLAMGGLTFAVWHRRDKLSPA